MWELSLSFRRIYIFKRCCVVYGDVLVVDEYMVVMKFRFEHGQVVVERVVVVAFDRFLFQKCFSRSKIGRIVIGFSKGHCPGFWW